MFRITKILIANRGEIANRILKAASASGIETVAVYAEDDNHSLHVSNADEAYSLGHGTMKETYLNISKIIQIAVSAGCDAVHPGYGFLSENYLFALACQQHNLLFVGPSPQVLRLMGDKTEARNTVKQLNIPILEGFECSLQELLLRKDLVFPLIIKPALGGGGKGMYIVHNHDELKENFKTASREAGNYFADTRVYFEHYIERARHIEVQIAADQNGNVIHLFERECTIQRNFQKIIEEAPSASLNDKLREEITSAAVRIARAVKYTNLGTVEFLLDSNNNWYFIEMNTRIQVEHPVTEAVTGVDLVKLQLEIASGQPFSFTQDDIRIKGHAIEVRINAENPAKHFKPSSGHISLFRYPENCRFDTFIKNPYVLPSQYDSLLGKLIVWGTNRSEAHTKTLNYLRQVHIHGLSTNISFLETILKSEEFRYNQLYTRFCNQLIPSFIKEYESKKNRQPFYIPLIAFVYLNFQRKSSAPTSIWKFIGYWRTVQEVKVKLNKEVFSINYKENDKHSIYRIADTEYEAYITDEKPDTLLIRIDGIVHKVYYSTAENMKTCIEAGGFQYKLESPDLLRTATLHKNNHDTSESQLNGHIMAPLHGRVTKINVLENSKINRGDILLVIESMKTENNIIAPRSGLIKCIHVTEGVQVRDNTLLMELE